MALTSRALGSPAQTRQSKGKRVLTRRVGATRTKAVSQEVVWGVSAAGLGVGVGVGLPILFSKLEERDKKRIEEIRRINRETLQATGETLPEDELEEMRPVRYLDKLDVKDED